MFKLTPGYAPEPNAEETQKPRRGFFFLVAELRQEKTPASPDRVREKYDADLGWLSRDPIEEAGGLNLYGIVYNDPVNQWDYLGMFGQSWTSQECAAAQRFVESLSRQARSAIRSFDDFRVSIQTVRNWGSAQIIASVATGAASAIRSLVVAPINSARNAAANFSSRHPAYQVVRQYAGRLSANQGIVSEVVGNVVNLAAGATFFLSTTSWTGSLLDEIDRGSQALADSIKDLQSLQREMLNKIAQNCCNE